MAIGSPTVAPATAGTTGPSPLAWSHTAAGSNRYVLVTVIVKNGDVGALSLAVTYDGVAMTNLGHANSNNHAAGGVAIFGLANPPTGTKAVSVSWTGGANAIAASESVPGVDQTTPVGTVVTAFGDNSNGTSPPRATVASRVGDLVIDAVSYGSALADPIGSQLWGANVDNESAAGNAGSSSYVGAASVGAGWDPVTRDWWALVAVPLRAAGSGVAITKTVADNVGITDSAARKLTFNRAVANPVGIHDTALAAVEQTFTITINDHVSVLDTFADQEIDREWDQDDAVSIHDHVAVELDGPSSGNFLKSLAEAIGISDVVQAVKTTTGTGLIGGLVDSLMNTLILPQHRWIKLHVGDPGSDGLGHPAANTQRQQVTWGTALHGVAVSASDALWPNVAATETYRFFSAWTTETGGSPGLTGLIDDGAVDAHDNFQIDAGDLETIIAIASN